MTEKITIEFVINDGNRSQFLTKLQSLDEEDLLPCIGYRDETVERRDVLNKFASEMEQILRRHDHKTDWRERPIIALFKLLMLETEELRVALEFFEVKQARKELVDVANFALILHDRLGLLDQDRNYGDQEGHHVSF